MAQLYSALDFGSSGYRLESCRGHKGRVKNRAKAMIDHLPFLHSQTHFYSFHSCDSVILVFVFLHFLYISLFILECSKFNRLLYDYFVVTRAEIWSKFIEYPFLISYKDIVIKRINSHKKNQYARTGFFV